MKKITASLLLGSLLLAGHALADATLPGAGVKVQPIQSSLPEESFQTQLVSKLLTRLGYEVAEAKEVDYNVGYTTVAAGDGSFLAYNWSPLHDDKYEKAGGDRRFYRQGSYVNGAAQGYLIDKRTAERYGIHNLAQLKDPKIAALFDSDGDGLADLAGCNPGWGCERMINHQLDAFGLTQTVHHNQGNYAAIIADTLTRYRSGKPVLYYTWTPYWVSAEMVPGRDVVWLEVPFSAQPDDAAIDTRLPNGKNYGFQVNQMHIVANKAFAEANPAAAALFAQMQLPLADINAQNALMRQGQSAPADVARHADAWLAGHQALVEQWLSRARDAARP